MQVIKKGIWRLLSHPEDLYIFDQIQAQNYKVVSTLKENYRSRVYRIALEDRDLVLKIPNEKNDRKWIRFLTWFRLGEAFKNLKGMQQLADLDIKTTIPLIAAEKRSAGMVVDSWLVYEYLDGKSCLDNEEAYPNVVARLKEMHQKKILHGDPQIRNFMLKDNIIYVIDSNPKSTGIFGFSKAYEFAYLLRSAPGIDKYFGDFGKTLLYRWALGYDTYERKIARFRKKVKKKVKGLFSSKN